MKYPRVTGPKALWFVGWLQCSKGHPARLVVISTSINYSCESRSNNRCTSTIVTIICNSVVALYQRQSQPRQSWERSTPVAPSSHRNPSARIAAFARRSPAVPPSSPGHWLLRGPAMGKMMFRLNLHNVFRLSFITKYIVLCCLYGSVQYKNDTTSFLDSSTSQQLWIFWRQFCPCR